MNTTTVLDLIAAREAAPPGALEALRKQMANLAAEVTAIDSELVDLATTRQTLTRILEHKVTEPVFTHGSGVLRAKDVCLAIGIGTEPKHTEGIRAKLKRLVIRADPDRNSTRPIHPHPGADITSRTNF